MSSKEKYYNADSCFMLNKVIKPHPTQNFTEISRQRPFQKTVKMLHVIFYGNGNYQEIIAFCY